MMNEKALLIVLLAGLLCCAAAENKNLASGECEMGHSSAYPPSLHPLPTGEAKKVEMHVLSLDDPPEMRWPAIVAQHRAGIRKLVGLIVDVAVKVVGNETFSKALSDLEARLPDFYAAMPDPQYGVEIKSIAHAVGLREALIYIYNIFYTVFGACTSIVAQDDRGDIFHARNLDFGLWPAFNFSDGNFWEMTAALRPIVISVDVQRGGASLYKMTTFAGFIGVHSAMKPNAFALSIDTRFDSHYDAGLLRYLLAPKLDGGFEITMATRRCAAAW